MRTPEFVSLGADRIAYRESGAGFPILFLHSNSASSKMFHPQVDSDLSDRFRLIAMDLPGHGDSSDASDPEQKYTMRGLAQSIAGFLGAMSIGNCLIVGSSMGGNLALEVTSGWGGVAGIMLFGCAPVDRKLACFAHAFYPSDDFGLVFQPQHSAAETEKPATRLVQGEPQAPRFMVDDVGRTDGEMRRIIGQAISAGEFVDEVELVAHSPVPLAVVLGENDAVVNIDYLRGLSYANLWRGEVQIIGGAAHAPQLENPDAFNRLLAQFAGEVAGAVSQ